MTFLNRVLRNSTLGFVHPSVSWSIAFYLPHVFAVISLTAPAQILPPAHPHAIGVAMYPAITSQIVYIDYHDTVVIEIRPGLLQNPLKLLMDCVLKCLV